MGVNRITAMSYICYAWRYNDSSQGRLSREGESLEDFKRRMENIFPHSEDWYRQYSEWKEIF